MIDFVKVLTDAGLQVQPYDGWQTRGHDGTLRPVGMLWHHTGGLKDLGIVAVTGRPDLAAPLANFFLDREGVWHVVAAGVAWHAGEGSNVVLGELSAGKGPASVDTPHGPSTYAIDRKLPNDQFHGNAYLLGVEVEALGNGSVYPQVQVGALVKGSAAIARAYGWTAGHFAHHREWTDRKVDMDLADTMDLRAAVAAELNAPTPAQTGESETVEIKVVNAKGKPGALLRLDAAPGEPLARVFSSPEWTAFHRRYYNPDGSPKDPSVTIKVETIPADEYHALVGPAQDPQQGSAS